MLEQTNQHDDIPNVHLGGNLVDVLPPWPRAGAEGNLDILAGNVAMEITFVGFLQVFINWL